jgi:broad specificity phosphatase PhoE
LVRHGESEGNADHGIYQDKQDYMLNLTPRGRQQAAECGHKIRDLTGGGTLMVYRSPFERARQTFEGMLPAIEGSIWRVTEDPRIREQDWGHFRSTSDINMLRDMRDGYGPFFYRIEDGESGADVYDRVSSFFDTLHRDFEKDTFPENCLLVTHGLLIKIFLMRWFHWDYRKCERMKNPDNCGIVVLERGADGKYDLASPVEFKDAARAGKLREPQPV